MKSIGGKMFKGAAIGGGLGGIGGGIYGNLKAQEIIDAQPYDSVEIRGGKMPEFGFKEHWDGSVSWKFTPGEMPEMSLAKSNEAAIRGENIVAYATIGAAVCGVGGALVALAVSGKE